jgi:hypothetical protein
VKRRPYAAPFAIAATTCLTALAAPEPARAEPLRDVTSGFRDGERADIQASID